MKPDRDFYARLAKVLGLLDSAFDGEALSAARRAHAMVQRAGLSWSDVLAASPSVRAMRTSAGPRAHRARHMVRACLDEAEFFNARELQFLKLIRRELQRGCDLSPKQRAWLVDLFERARHEAAA